MALQNFWEIEWSHLLMAIIFKFHKYQTLNLTKMHNMNKFDLPVINSVYEKVRFTIKRAPKTLWKSHTNKGPFNWFFKLARKYSCITKKICFFFFLSERNFTTSLLLIHLKCTVVYYINLNSSSLNKPLLNYDVASNKLFLFFLFLFMFILTRLLSKTLWKKSRF